MSPSKSPRLFIRDKISQFSFLIDCGSDVSLIPRSCLQGLYRATPYRLYAANYSPINTYGLHTVQLDIGLPSKYTWNLIIADVSTPIFGADFLKHHHILPDLIERRLVDGLTLTSVKGYLRSTKCHSISAFKLDHESKISQLLQRFADVVKPPKYQEKPLHDVKHYIYTNSELSLIHISEPTRPY